MKKLPSNFELDRYGLHVRFVREEEKEGKIYNKIGK